MAKRYTKIDRALFEQAKALQAYKVKPIVISQITGMSAASVSRVRKASDWDAFKQMRRQHAEYNRQKQVAAESAPDLNREIENELKGSPEDVMNTPVLSLEEREVIALERQAQAMERMADAWEAAPTRKGIFRG